METEATLKRHQKEMAAHAAWLKRHNLSRQDCPKKAIARGSDWPKWKWEFRNYARLECHRKGAKRVFEDRKYRSNEGATMI